MALTNAFFEAVKSSNIRRVRIMMQDSLLVDSTFDEFYEMEKASFSMEGLYDEHDGKEFVTNRSQWDDDYMDKIMVKVLSNFSHERIDHLKEVVRYLRPVTKQATAKKTEINKPHCYDNARKSSYQEGKRRCQENGDYRGAKIGVGAVAGAAFGSATAYFAGASAIGVVVGIAAGSVVGGIATAIIVNGGK